MSDIKERILLFIKEKKISITEFERSIGVSSGYVANISKSIQPDKLENISDNYPDLSIEWLLIGRGERLKNKPSNDQVSTNIGGDVHGSGNVIGNRVESGNINGNDNKVGIMPSDCEKALVRAKAEIDILKKKIKENEILNKKKLEEIVEQYKREIEILNKMLEQSIAAQDRAVKDKDLAMSLLEKALTK